MSYKRTENKRITELLNCIEDIANIASLMRGCSQGLVDNYKLSCQFEYEDTGEEFAKKLIRHLKLSTKNYMGRKKNEILLFWMRDSLRARSHTTNYMRNWISIGS